MSAVLKLVIPREVGKVNEVGKRCQLRDTVTGSGARGGETVNVAATSWLKMSRSIPTWTVAHTSRENLEK